MSRNANISLNATVQKEDNLHCSSEKDTGEMFHEGSKDCLDFLSDIALALVGSMYQEIYSYT